MTDDRCPYHVKCRADHARSPDHLCGFHHAKTWNWCTWYLDYEYQERMAKAQESATARKADEAIVKGNEA